MATEKLRQFASAAAAAAVNITRPNYFDTSRRGETYELRTELNSDVAIVRKEAVKKVIASMTTGKDVSNLFPDVLKNVQTEDMELKKLVYLYLMNYAKSQPELVILAINSICKDAEDPNPLVRALAIRTMGCLRVERVLDYLCEPLRRALTDENAYVRKTAATCVAKVAELSPTLAEDNGFIQMLRTMLSDVNASVMANAVAALVEIQTHNSSLQAFQLDSPIANRLVSTINECTEWGQIAILDALAHYRPISEAEAVTFLEKITPRLQHVNSGLVLSSVKVIVILLDFLSPDHPLRQVTKKKLAPPLVSLLDAPSELQYVALRNISLVLSKFPDMLGHNIRVFFCKFNDPLYVKLEKLTIIQRLVDENNFDQVLQELSEYSREVDVEFSHNAIQAIAFCGIKITIGFAKALLTLQKLLQEGSPSTLQSITLATQIMLRQDPANGFELANLLLQRELDLFDNDEARAAYVWLVGQFAAVLPLERTQACFHQLIDDFCQEPYLVQSEVLTTLVKLFFQDASTYSPLLRQIIELGLVSAEGNDLHERFSMLSRLLDVDASLLRTLEPTALRLGSPTPNELSPPLLNKLLPEMGTVTSVYHCEVSMGGAVDGHEQMQSLVMPDLLLDLADEDNMQTNGIATAANHSFSPSMNKSDSVESSSNSKTGGSENSRNSATSSPIVDLLGD